MAVPAPAERELMLGCYQKKKLNIINGLSHAEESRGNLPLFLVLVKH